MAVKQLEQGIYEVMVDRPEKFNALSSKIIAGLVSDFRTACEDETTRVIIFRGAQAKKYLSPFGGADLEGLVDTDKWQPIPADSAREHMEEGLKAIRDILALCRRNKDRRIFVIGMVDGPCLAGGVEFMFGLCDIVLATRRTVFGMREILLNGMGGWGGPQTLRRIFGNPAWVKEMLLALGDQRDGDISAETALARGMVNSLVSEGEIVSAVLEMAQRVVKLDPLAVSYNLEAADMPMTVDCTPRVTDWMVALMMRQPWVDGVKDFFESLKK